MIYFVIYLSSCFLIYISKKICFCYGKEHTTIHKTQMIILCIGLILPALLAFYRDTSIGSDVELYVVPFFNRAYANNDFFKYRKKYKIDILYQLLNFGVSRFTPVINWLFIILAGLNIIIIFISLWNLRALIKPWLGMICYYFLFYNRTFSTVRQSVACSMVLLAFSILFTTGNKKKGYKIAIMLIAIAAGFHMSVIITLGLVIMYYLFDSSFNKKRVFLNISIAAIFGAVMLRITPLSIHSIVSFLSNKYASSNYFEFSNTGSNRAMLFLEVSGMIILVLLLRKKHDEYKTLNFFLAGSHIILLALLIFTSKLAFIMRLLLYVQYFDILIFAQGERLVKKNGGGKIVMNLLIICLLCVFWWFYYIHVNIGETYPYTSQILGIGSI